MKHRKKLGVALGSGGFRGLYHVGVLKALEKNNIPIDRLAGSSIGAWAGGFYALYQDAALLEQFAIGGKFDKLIGIFDFSLAGGGLIKGLKWEKLLDGWFNRKTFRSLKIPFRAVATDFRTGKNVIFSTGKLAFAVRASTSVPGVFVPARYKNKILVDGGLSNPVPDDVVRRMGADIVLAVDLMTEIATPKAALGPDMPLGVRDVLGASVDILSSHLAELTTRDANILLRPRLGKYSNWGDYFLHGRLVKEVIAAGERDTEKIIPELRGLLSNTR